MDIEKLISSEPMFVENEFARLLNIPQNRTDSKEKFIEYGQLLNDQCLSKNDQYFRSFLLGYFDQRAGSYCSNQNERGRLFKESLFNYQTFQNARKNGNANIRYYAQWQIGLLQQSMGYKWSIAEGSYLEAMEYHSQRGEALREIIIYQCSMKNWPAAIIYSTYCMEHFLGKVPAETRWFVNIAFYKWKIVKYHITILLNLNKKEVAKECAENLFGRYLANVDLDAKEKDEIYSLKKSWAMSL
jgi:hypothetical protein